ncbi:hypothetical protein CEXT_803001 [Caerostris extrusa]|uniref:Uncharacterized protein n=1 Tax=Caerostris extrusa TaxID=172846 RepID=A0AAV4MDW2_CAEEX|nr:hypothetical protein CEXT_803001 [Caerostris extrusa]
MALRKTEQNKVRGLVGILNEMMYPRVAVGKLNEMKYFCGEVGKLRKCSTRVAWTLEEEEEEGEKPCMLPGNMFKLNYRCKCGWGREDTPPLCKAESVRCLSITATNSLKSNYPIFENSNRIKF